MLAGCCRKLLTISDTVSVMARREDRIRAIAPQIHVVPGDYADENALLAALSNLAPDLIVAWIHGRQPHMRRLLASRLRTGGRFIQVLGSAHGDPARPDRLAEMKTVVEGLPIVYQAVVLGFVLEATGARWLTHAEISDGVFGAVESGAAFTVVGSIEPWSARP